MTRTTSRSAAVSAGALAMALAAAAPAWAQTEAVSTVPASAPGAPGAPPPGTLPAGTQPSEIMTINLIRLLVQKGVITQDAADGLIRQAQAEAQQAKLAAAPPQELPAPEPGVVRVPYVPQVVRDQIRDEVKQDVMAQAKSEGWASPGALPDWIGRITWFGDFRFRDQFNFYSGNNEAPYIDFATLNANGPIDVNGNTNPTGLPFLNTRSDRLDQFSLRARLGMTASIFQGVSATIRLASGNDNSPVSTTQILGGGLAKKDIWLDQAFLKLEPIWFADVYAGRMPDLFMHTDMMFDDNLNFDGAAATANHPYGPPGLAFFGTLGAFPLFYGADNFPTESAIKEDSHTPWLFAVQAGAEYKPDPLAWSVRGAVAFYDFDNVQGELSDPCAIYAGVTQCSTDQTRPAFMQKGNTLFLLRDIIPDPASPLNYAQPQFVGLSYNYRVLDAIGAFEMPLFGATRLVFEADYARNMSFNPAAAFANPLAVPINNYDAGSSADQVGPYHSGQNAYLVQATMAEQLRSRRAPGDWNAVVGYKYIEPDAVLDAFNDHDFHLGGTNAKGYFVSASYYFATNTWVSGRWYSANQVFGFRPWRSMFFSSRSTPGSDGCPDPTSGFPLPRPFAGDRRGVGAGRRDSQAARAAARHGPAIARELQDQQSAAKAPAAPPAQAATPLRPRRRPEGPAHRGRGPTLAPRGGPRRPAPASKPISTRRTPIATRPRLRRRRRGKKWPSSRRPTPRRPTMRAPPPASVTD